MRPLWKDVLIALLLGMILPGIALNGFVRKESNSENQQVPVQQTEAVSTADPCISVRMSDGTQSTMAIGQYLTGVLLAEIPAAFHPEALKAQAVAARTYIWKAHTTGGKHGDGSICTDSSCCQAYVSEHNYLDGGGTPEDLEKVRSAVEATYGMVLAYEGTLIEATYFSSSGGSTESAVAVWGTNYPYLQAVSSPEEVICEERIYNRLEFLKLLDIPGSENSAYLLVSVTNTAGGGVASMEICGKVFKGVQLRSLLGLRSTAFQVLQEGDKIIVKTRGYGHRVGMSQYGANAMAEKGSSWQQILQHYYPGTTLYPAY